VSGRVQVKQAGGLLKRLVEAGQLGWPASLDSEEGPTAAPGPGCPRCYTRVRPSGAGIAFPSSVRRLGQPSWPNLTPSLLRLPLALPEGLARCRRGRARFRKPAGLASPAGYLARIGTVLLYYPGYTLRVHHPPYTTLPGTPSTLYMLSAVGTVCTLRRAHCLGSSLRFSLGSPGSPAPKPGFC